MEKKVWKWDDIKFVRYLIRTDSREVYRIGYSFFSQWLESRYYLRRVTCPSGEPAKNNSLTIYGLTQQQLVRHLNSVGYHLPVDEKFNALSDEEVKLVSELVNAEIERNISLLIYRGGKHRNRRYENRQDALESHNNWSKVVDDLEYGLWQIHQITRESNPEVFLWPKSECN